MQECYFKFSLSRPTSPVWSEFLFFDNYDDCSMAFKLFLQNCSSCTITTSSDATSMSSERCLSVSVIVEWSSALLLSCLETGSVAYPAILFVLLANVI